MKRMLINATQPEELRVALVDGQRLYDLDIEATGHEQRKSNIYKARIVRVEPSLEAAFVDYGADRHGFLPLKEVSRDLYKDKAKGGGKVNIKDALDEGQEIVVQVEKEERGNKGAALTTFLSLAGRYLVAMPNNPRAGGVSRQIEGDDREQAREAMSSLEIPSNLGLILRTAGIGKTAEELQWDLDYLVHLWSAIKDASESRKGPFLIYQDRNVAVRAIRDYLRSDIAEILIDDDLLYKQACEFMQAVMPHNLTKLKFYSDSVPLFTRYQIESQIEKAFSRDVRLPAGGGLVFEPTEAMITIDINSARSTGGQDIEETALHTNLEAADEVATQMRLRDVGGLIVIDFIDMMNPKNQRAVENRLREAVKLDRARVQIGRISRFGLLEMSRQRLRPSLTEFSHTLCPRCEGVGTIRSTRSTALALLRVLEEESMKDSTAKVIAQAPVDAATFLLNEKRQDIANIEERQNIQVLLIPNQNLETPHFEIQRIRAQDTDITEAVESYSLVTEVESPAVDNGAAVEKARDKEVAAVQPIVHTAPKPPAREEAAAPGPGFFQRLFGSLLGGAKVAPAAEQPKPQPAKRDSRSRDDNRRRRSGGGDKRSGNSQRNRQQRPKASDDSASEQAASGSSEQPGREKRSSRSRRGRGSRGGRRRSGGQNNQNEGKADEQSAGSAGNNAGDKGQGDRSGNGLGSDQRGARDDTRGNKQDSDAGDIQSKGQGGSQGAVQANSQAGSQNKAAGETAKEASASVPRHENAPPAASKSDAPRPAESPAAPPAPAAAGGGGSASRPSDTAPAPVQSNDQAGG